MRLLRSELGSRQSPITVGIVCVVAVIGVIWAVVGLGPSGTEQRDTDSDRVAKTTTTEHQRVWSAVWAFRPKSVAGLVGHTQVVVAGEVSEVRKGDDLVRGSEAEPGGEQRIPTQRIDIDRLTVLAGSITSTFTLFKTGSLTAHLEDDPPYAVGERYVLFLTSQAAGEGTYIPVAPDGRLREDANGHVHPEIEGPVGDALDGKTVGEVTQIVRRVKSSSHHFQTRREAKRVASEGPDGSGGTP